MVVAWCRQQAPPVVVASPTQPITPERNASPSVPPVAPHRKPTRPAPFFVSRTPTAPAPAPSRVVQLIVSHQPVLGPFSPVLDNLDQVILERGISLVKGSSVATSTSGCMLAYPIRVIPAWVSFEIITFLGLRNPMGPPIVLGVPLGSPKTSYVPPGSHVARVREPAGAKVRAKASWRATRSERGEP
ncbi:hypothetical protein E6C27_scaffold207G002190 [Cucumis melo var. makuwa]|uniref:Uncharacterized protein n=1 Tax=Cucumis melo var. makuwa TaxID=1194695 RepID=A0A5A7U9D6_CUCMM|nr:hypothetical protein E6C27_scaffold207G002190 [Cucumis melo var. makuwa]